MALPRFLGERPLATGDGLCNVSAGGAQLSRRGPPPQAAQGGRGVGAGVGGGRTGLAMCFSL
eukprot:231468-Pyramimonas_sp.AAC.1